MDKTADGDGGQLSETFETLGQALAAEAARLRRRSQPGLPWLELFADITSRVSGYSVGGHRNYRRVTPDGRDGGLDADQDGFGPPSDVASALRAAVGSSADDVRVHVGPQADGIARSQRADAVTMGTDVFFREGRFRPHEPEGYALLLHEATHVAEATRPGAEPPRSPTEMVAAERRALANEWAALRSAPGHSPDAAAKPLSSKALAGVSRPGVAVAAAVPAAAGPALAAAESRPVPAAAEPDMEELGAAVRRDLLDQIRSDFERGG